MSNTDLVKWDMTDNEIKRFFFRKAEFKGNYHMFRYEYFRSHARAHGVGKYAVKGARNIRRKLVHTFIDKFLEDPSPGTFSIPNVGRFEVVEYDAKMDGKVRYIFNSDGVAVPHIDDAFNRYNSYSVKVKSSIGASDNLFKYRSIMGRFIRKKFFI